ncbi:degenerate transposase [Streptococcus pneumoniae]|nr:degenerate transposase [Streptococcus pneumoniae]
MCENIELMNKLRLILVFHESNLLRRSQWVEVTLVKGGVTISRTPLSSEDTVMIDATEVQINRPKKIN